VIGTVVGHSVSTVRVAETLVAKLNSQPAGYAPPIMTSSTTFCPTSSAPDKGLCLSGGECNSSARFVRKPTEISVRLALGAVARVARYRDTGSGVESTCCSVRGKLWATLLAYSPRRNRHVSMKVALVRGLRAAMGIEGLEKWLLMTFKCCQRLALIRRAPRVLFFRICETC